MLFTWTYNSVYLISTGSLDGQLMIIQLLICVYNNMLLYISVQPERQNTLSSVSSFCWLCIYCFKFLVIAIGLCCPLS